MDSKGFPPKKSPHFWTLGWLGKYPWQVGADMNAKDDREYTAVAHAEANNHFVLMDRLVQLGGRGHGLHQKKENDTWTKNQIWTWRGLVNSKRVSVSVAPKLPWNQLGKPRKRDDISQ